MRTALLWLLMLGVFAGLSARAVPALHLIGHAHEHDEAHHVDLEHPTGHDHSDHHHHGSDHHQDHEEHDVPQDPAQESEDDPDDSPAPDSSPNHFHYHGCVAPSPLAAGTMIAWSSHCADFHRVGYEALELLPPDGPLLESQAPPLI
jgi:hypothetical protein